MGIKEHDTCVQIVLGSYLNSLLAKDRITDQQQFVLKRPDLNASPRHRLDDALALTWYRHHVADLEWLVRLKSDAGEKIAERLLQSETDDDSQDRRTGKDGTGLPLDTGPETL